jgi:HD-like signal output (HDOD) protein
MSKRDEILSALKEIQLLSSPAQGALQVMRRPDATPEEIEQVLSLDPALTANLLRFANSVYFGCRSQVYTVKEAVVRLGLNMVSRMLMLSCASQFSSLPVRGYGLREGSLWDSMLSTAVATDLLATSLQIKPPAFTFTAGLLSGIGKLVLGTYLEMESTPIWNLVEEENISFDEAERGLLGIDHAEVGAALLEQWFLPEELVQVVRWGLTPDLCPGDKVAVDLVHTASFISMMSGAGLGLAGLGYDINKSSGERLGLAVHTVEEVLSHVQDEVHHLMQVH